VSPRVLVTTVPDQERHDTGRGHPERPARVSAVMAGIDAAQIDQSLVREAGRPATIDELARVHDSRYVHALETFAAEGGGHLDPDTPVAPGSFAVALLAAGAGLVALEGLRSGIADSAFVVARPPGHHATRTRGQGFCLFNNVAVSAAELAERGERVVIVDWDVHHGNGTQDIFWDDPRVLYVSTHQSPAYPGTGRFTETGGANAPGLTINVPLPPGATGDVAVAALDEIVAPAIERFAPTWVLVSAGFDAHRDDPLADLAWSAGDYAELTRRVTSYAPGTGRFVAFLEGGYDLDALRRSVTATVGTMGGSEWEEQEAPTAGGPGRDVVAAVARLRTDEGWQ
jgi:acetoin utilization deacetylase AcuC-like enzyme